MLQISRYKITFIDECVVYTGRSKPPFPELHAQRSLLLVQNNLVAKFLHVHTEEASDRRLRVTSRARSTLQGQGLRSKKVQRPKPTALSLHDSCQCIKVGHFSLHHLADTHA